MYKDNEDCSRLGAPSTQSIRALRRMAVLAGPIRRRACPERKRGEDVPKV